MIGGHDEILKCERPDVVMDFLARYLRRLWPESVIEDADDQSPGPGPYYREFKGTEKEVFIYKTHVDAGLWFEHGACEATARSMVHLLRGVGSVTLVVDEPEHPETKALLEEVRHNLKLNWPMGMVRR